MSVVFPQSLSVSLHFLRGVSAQIVVIGHGLNFAGVGYAVRPPNFPYIQNIGVLVFFFMSGMVISQSIETNVQKGHYGIARFFSDRAIRFSITIIPCLAVIFFLDQLSVGNPNFSSMLESAISIPQFFGNVLMLQTHPLFDVDPFGTGRPLWSVALEWWTYMFFGFLILFSRSKPLEVLLFLPIFALSLPMIMSGFLGGRGLVLVWMLGAVSCYLIKRLPRIAGIFNWIVALGVFACMSPYFYRHVLTMKANYSIASSLSISLILFFVLYFISHAKLGHSGIFAKISKFIADYSFTLYCIHFSVFTLMQFTTSHRGWIFVLGGLFISNFLALAIASVTEMRYKIYRDWVLSKFSRLHGRGAIQLT